MPTTPPLVDIIFLDIDGVLLPFGDHHDILGGGAVPRTYADGCIFPDATMEALTTMLMELDENGNMGTMNGRIVLSSSWRSRPRFVRDILSSFRSYVGSRCGKGTGKSRAWESIFGHDFEFFDVTDTEFHSTRHDEVVNWINSATINGRGKFTIRSWIALDDEDLVNVEGRIMTDAIRHAVRTISSVGLTLDDVNVAMRLLERQVREFHDGSGGG
ncbi:hypothetical protein ACHAXA_004479 [Cyclostephanos tholiformis]|uniref:Uncharacterized protein n=1 Tax=Cyclostephanos tholiformis TaxID=382380 RepID=A0ABD3RYR7_9STRA